MRECLYYLHPYTQCNHWPWVPGRLPRAWHSSGWHRSHWVFDLLGAAHRSDLPDHRPVWTTRRCPRRPRLPRCWSPGRCCPSAIPPSSVLCKKERGLENMTRGKIAACSEKVEVRDQSVGGHRGNTRNRWDSTCDLRFIAGFVIIARETGQWEIQWRYTRRKRKNETGGHPQCSKSNQPYLNIVLRWLIWKLTNDNKKKKAQ